MTTAGKLLRLETEEGEITLSDVEIRVKNGWGAGMIFTAVTAQGQEISFKEENVEDIL